MKEKYNELLKIDNFFIEKSETHKGEYSLLFNFNAEWDIDNYSIVSFDNSIQSIFIDVPHDGIVSRLDFGGVKGSKVIDVAFKHVVSLIKEDKLNFIAQDNDEFFVILSKFRVNKQNRSD